MLLVTSQFMHKACTLLSLSIHNIRTIIEIEAARLIIQCQSLKTLLMCSIVFQRSLETHN